MKWNKILRYFSIVAGAGAITIVGILVYANVTVLRYPAETYHDIASVPTTTITLVLGGGMKEPGIMSEMQTDRVLQGVALYKAGKTEKLIMSGDDGALRNDEVTFMKELAVKEGVLEKDVSIDPHAYRTYLSCYRAREVYRIKEAIVISQNFHLPRILYLCNSMGVNSIGLSADLRSYNGTLWLNVREVLARVKALTQLKVTKPVK